jgi:deazaflavin-dependent oxidoreductase (nitroreductase family)
MARATAPIARAFAGRRFFPLWAVLHHRGRRSGRALSLPIAVQATPDMFLVVLPWGPGTNWVRNVLAAGGCRIRWKGADHDVTRPEVLGRAEARVYFDRFSWTMVEKVFHADAFLRLHRAG